MSVTADGIVGLSDMLGYFAALTEAGAMPYAKLFDARRLDSRLTDEDMAALAGAVRANAEFDPRGPIAAVATTPQARAAIERFKALGGARRPIEIFETVEGAKAWLALRR
ncbi:MAG: hypothetical protein U1E23_11575 [Reyranellaceae bacterium]